MSDTIITKPPDEKYDDGNTCSVGVVLACRKREMLMMYLSAACQNIDHSAEQFFTVGKAWNFFIHLFLLGSIEEQSVLKDQLGNYCILQIKGFLLQYCAVDIRS